MKTNLTIILLFCSIGVFGQTLPKGFITGKNYINYSNSNDTSAVYMLVTNKVKHGYPVQVMQFEGYSVTPKILYSTFPFSTYLDKYKKPISDSLIVWMSVKK